ncbi:MAG: pilus assembly protein CpaE [Chloroflexota bacterium]|nr:pilus assembly protein CpaE [Chloroflexota bacterium]
MPASRILLFDSDAAAGEAIRTSLSARGYSVTLTGDADEAFAQAPEHQLAIIDIASGPLSAVDVCREIRATPALASVPVMCVSASDDVEERILFLEAGADDVMARPFDARELEARVEALLLRFQRSKGLPPVVSADGLTLSRARRTVAVFSPKGGAGTTTLATNVAIAAVARRPDRVILVDFALQFGGVATLLDLDPKQTIADVVRDEAFVREPEQLRTFAMRHDSGLHVLASPAVPEAAETITSAHVEGILATLLDGYDMIVVDAGSTLDERVLTIFDAVDNVILVVTPEMGALKTMRALLEYLREAGSIGQKATFVLNNPYAREFLKVEDVESFLGSRVAFEIPYDATLYLKAVNEGIPIVMGAPRSMPAERLVALSALAFGGEDFKVPTGQPGKKTRGLFRRRT